MSAQAAERRRQAVLQILQGRAISTQEQLLGALRRGGFRSTQATLSRDLARLGVRRAPRPGGGAVYEIGDGPAPPGSALSGLVGSVATNGSTVVVRTRPGSAPAVARAIDLAGLAEVLGTIAGDDTNLRGTGPGGPRARRGRKTRGHVRLGREPSGVHGSAPLASPAVWPGRYPVSAWTKLKSPAAPTSSEPTHTSLLRVRAATAPSAMDTWKKATATA